MFRVKHWVAGCRVVGGREFRPRVPGPPVTGPRPKGKGGGTRSISLAGLPLLPSSYRGLIFGVFPNVPLPGHESPPRKNCSVNFYLLKFVYNFRGAVAGPGEGEQVTLGGWRGYAWGNNRGSITLSNTFDEQNVSGFCIAPRFDLLTCLIGCRSRVHEVYTNM